MMETIDINADTPHGLLLAIGILIFIIVVFRWSLRLAAGKHRDSWVITLLYWGGLIGLALNLLGVRLGDLILKLAG